MEPCLLLGLTVPACSSAGSGIGTLAFLEPGCRAITGLVPSRHLLMYPRGIRRRFLETAIHSGQTPFLCDRNGI
jgi:hypothetical protein